MPEYSWSLWLPVFGGGLAGSIFTLVGQNVRNWWLMPKLTAHFGKDVAGSTVKHDFSRPPNNRESGTAHWTRVKIINNGRSTAKNVRVIIVRVTNKSIQSRNWDFTAEAIDCWWAHSKEMIDIPSKTWRFSDILYVESVGGSDKLRFTGKGAGNIPDGVERLSIEAMMAADNCETITFTVNLRYEGLGRGMAFE